MRLKKYNIKLVLTLLCLIVFVVSLGFGFFQYKKELSDDERLSREKDWAFIQYNKTHLPEILGYVYADLRMLQSLPAMTEFLADPSPENKQRLSILFATFSQNRGVYDQIRMLDQTGQERVRVNYVLGESVVVPEEKLQNKKGRYYFDESFMLDENEIYISPLDLNVEQNKIEEPYKPMLRIATPLFSGEEKQGILVLNYLAENFLSDLGLTGAVEKEISDGLLIYMVDKEGYWLLTDKPEQAWGFMFEDKKNLKLANENPKLWAVINKFLEGQVMLDEGLYTYTTISPNERQDLKWKVYLFDPKKNVYSRAQTLKSNLYKIFLGEALLLFLILITSFKIVNKARASKEQQVQMEGLYKNLYNESTDAIMLIAPPDWKFVDGNAATLKVFDIKSADEFLRCSPDMLSPKYQPNGKLSSQASLEMIKKALETGINNFDWVHQTAVGKEFKAHVSLGRIKVGEKIFIQAVVRDITEEKRVEEIKAEEMAKTAKALAESERFNRLMVGREMEMVKLKKEIAQLKQDIIRK